MNRDYREQYQRAGALGRLVFDALEKKHTTVDYAASSIQMRRGSFRALLYGQEKTLSLSVEQAIRLGEFLDVDPVQLIEAYLHDVSYKSIAQRYAHTYTDLYVLFQWYRVHLGQEVSDTEVLSDVSAVLYLYEVYRKVRRDDQLYLNFRKILNAFVETMEGEGASQGTLGK